MIQKEVLRQIVYKQKSELTINKETVRREILDEILKWIDDNRVLILTGLRRSGKSTLLQQLMVETKKWCYLNFEDERLIDFKAQDFEMLNEVLLEAYGTAKIYYFDEIQNIEKFETFIRRLQDEGKKIIITGSNATLLSKEFGTRLTGRYKAFEIYPFSFHEFLRFSSMDLKVTDWYETNKKVKLLEHFESYLKIGGLPEYVKNNDKEYIRTVFENILYKDVITRYSIKREKTIKELVNILATNVASQITYNSLKQTLSLSNAITVKEYISYLNNSYLFFELLKISYSIKKQLASPRKIYLVDSAFHQVCGSTFSPDKGKILENFVFIQLKRKNNELYYHSNKKECDFILKDGKEITQAIQVCYNLNNTNREREVAGLIEAMNAYNLKEGTIITFEQSEEVTIDARKIKIIPAAIWALKNVND